MKHSTRTRGLGRRFANDRATRKKLWAIVPFLLVFTGLCGPSALETNGQITDQLVVHLTFDDTFSDISGRGNHGTGVNAPVFDNGQIGRAITVNGDGVQAPNNFSQYVTLGTAADLNFGSAVDFSVSLWSKFSTWSGDPVFLSNKNWDSGNNTGWVLSTGSDGRFQWNYREVSPQTRKDYDGPAGTISNNLWHHLVVTFDRGGNAIFYLDGVSTNTTSLGTGGQTIDSGLATNIGQDGTGTYTDGGGGVKWTNALIDDVGIWRRVITPSEVSAIYQAGLAGQNLQSIPEPVSGSLAVVALLACSTLRRRISG